MSEACLQWLKQVQKRPKGLYTALLDAHSRRREERKRMDSTG